MPASITAVRTIVRDAIALEFTAEAFPVVHDKLHPALGMPDGLQPIAGVFPLREGPSSGDANVLLMDIGVQVFGGWDARIDPTQQVDPSAIEGWAWRFQRRLRLVNDPGTAGAWFLQLIALEYPDDPTGNKTRFEASIRAYANNPTYVETAA